MKRKLYATEINAKVNRLRKAKAAMWRSQSSRLATKKSLDDITREYNRCRQALRNEVKI